MIWTGRAMTILPSLLMVFSAVGKLRAPTEVVEQMSKIGWPATLLTPLGIVELLCVVLYLIPQTAMLGAILLTGYLGGALAAHLRIGEPWFIQFLLGVVIWGGLYCRDSRIRSLIPVWKR
jgi:hypothetical protein